MSEDEGKLVKGEWGGRGGYRGKALIIFSSVASLLSEQLNFKHASVVVFCYPEHVKPGLDGHSFWACADENGTRGVHFMIG